MIAPISKAGRMACVPMNSSDRPTETADEARTVRVARRHENGRAVGWATDVANKIGPGVASLALFLVAHDHRIEPLDFRCVTPSTFIDLAFLLAERGVQIRSPSQSSLRPGEIFVRLQVDVYPPRYGLFVVVLPFF